MNITFLVGNGFDIACGIDTSYGAFYEWYCDKPSNKKHIEEFKKNIKEDINGEGKNWVDFELGLGKYTKHFTVDTVDDFLDCYDDAQSSIIKFVEEKKSLYDLENLPNEELIKFKKGLTNFHTSVYPQEQKRFNELFNKDTSNNRILSFLSFNYSDTLDKLLEAISGTPLKEWDYNNIKRKMYINPKIIHMHGTLSQFPIIGVNDASQIANQELLKVPDFANAMLKPQCVSAIGRLWHEEAEEEISKSTIICVFGMSLGESDAKWWGRLVKWLKDNSNRHLIVYWYSKNPPDGISTRRELSEQRQVKEKLCGYHKLNEDEFDNIKSRIHVVVNTKDVLNVNLSRKEAVTV